MDKLGPIGEAVAAVLDDLQGAGGRPPPLGARPHPLAGRPDRGGRPARAGSTWPAPWPPRTSGSRTFADALVRRRHRARRGDGHGRLEPLPRGPGPVVPAPARPARAAGARHHRPGPAPARLQRVPARDHLVRRLVEVRHHHRDAEPPGHRHRARRRHRPRSPWSPTPDTPLAERATAERLPGPVREPGRHRRPLLGAVVLRPGAGGRRRSRRGRPAGLGRLRHALPPGHRPGPERRAPPGGGDGRRGAGRAATSSRW